MTRDLTQFRNILEATQGRMQLALRRREGIAIERSADASDEAQYAVDREVSTWVLDSESCQLAAVRLALQRIEDGTYGTCQRCEEAIGAKRLRAVPWACYCIRCQEYVDKTQEAELKKPGRLLAAGVAY